MPRIYEPRWLTRDLAEKVAVRLTERDALRSHARDELGISETVTAHPIQAALVSAMTFAVGAVVPLLVAMLAPPTQIVPFVAVATLLSLAILGGRTSLAWHLARYRRRPQLPQGGALAMAETAPVGSIFGVAVG